MTWPILVSTLKLLSIAHDYTRPHTTQPSLPGIWRVSTDLAKYFSSLASFSDPFQFNFYPKLLCIFVNLFRFDFVFYVDDIFFFICSSFILQISMLWTDIYDNKYCKDNLFLFTQTVCFRIPLRRFSACIKLIGGLMRLFSVFIYCFRHSKAKKYSIRISSADLNALSL